MVRLSLQPRMVIAALIGAVVGVLLVLLLEITGHTWWSVLLMIVAAVGPSVIKLTYENRERQPINFLQWTRYRVQTWMKVGSTLLLVIATLVVLHFLGLNPRDHGYIPLLLPAVVSAILFGSGPALFAIILSTIIADYVYAIPADEFAITNWEDAAGLATFAVVGALAALAVSDFFLLDDEA